VRDSNLLENDTAMIVMQSGEIHINGSQVKVTKLAKTKRCRVTVSLDPALFDPPDR